MNSVVVYSFVDGDVQQSNFILDFVSSTQFLNEGFKQRQQSDVIYTDFEKAFDSLDHGLLVSKLSVLERTLGLSSVTNLVISYLNGRTCFVSYNLVTNVIALLRRQGCSRI